MTDVQQARIEAAARAMIQVGGDGFGVVVERDGMSILDAYTEYARAAIAAADAVVTAEAIIGVLDHEGAQCGNCGLEPGDPADCTDCARVLARYAAAIQRLYRGEEQP